ncbi:MAG: family 43 glycosylhydrolase [Myxococcales bacterium]|nr:family 43 glycosylhydrolase [Myxococcales bacterium]
MSASLGHANRLTVAFFVTAGMGSCVPPSWQPGSRSDDAGGPIVTKPGDAGGAPAPDSSSPPPPDGSVELTYTNPVSPGDFPDPFVLRDGTRYYAFGTNVPGKNVPVLTSTDLSTWTELPDALPVLPDWARANASLTWAPSVLQRGSTFVLYYTARSIASGFQCIGRAVATSPAGPYVDDSSGPFVCQVDGDDAFCGSIDASPFVNANGDAYLLWKSDENAAACKGDARLWAQRLGVDGLSLLGKPTELLRRELAWETPLVEGPSMLLLGGAYYLFYSAGWWESSSYAIGYAVCDGPLGPCTKKTLDGPLVASLGNTLGPGGQEFFTDPNGKTWMAYHGWSSPIVGYANGGARALRIDPIEVVDGVPSLAGPTSTPRPL